MSVVLPRIFIVGKAGSGKTTTATMLVERFDYHRFALADPLKAMLGTTTDRGAMQGFGTAVRAQSQIHAGHPDAWLNLLLWRIEQCHADQPVVDDVRFPNEAHRLVEEGWVSIRVTADRNARVARLQANGKLQDEAQLEHESETALDKFECDHEIDNSHNDSDHLLEALTEILNKERR